MTNDLKTFITSDEPSELEKQQFNKVLKIVSAESLDSYPEIVEDYTAVTDGTSSKLEIRNVSLAMPTSFWKAYDNFVKLTEERTRLGIEESDDPVEKIQAKIVDMFKEKVNLDVDSVLASQFILEGIVSFAGYLSKVEFQQRLEKAVASGDNNTIIDLVNKFAPLVDEPEDEDESN